MNKSEYFESNRLPAGPDSFVDLDVNAAILGNVSTRPCTARVWRAGQGRQSQSRSSRWRKRANLAPDRLSLYFSSDQRPGPSYPPGDFYMYVATRDTLGGDWSVPKPCRLS